MNQLLGWLTFVVMMLAAVWYCPLIVKSRVKPAPATWIVGCMGMSLSVWFYWHTANRTFMGNVLNFAAMVEIATVFVVLMITLWRRGELRLAFDGLQRFCIATMICAFVYWYFNKDQAGLAFWIAQGMLAVAHFATVFKIVGLGRNVDSLGNWGFILAGSLIGAIPAFMSGNHYGIVNSIRAVVLTIITLGTLAFFDKKNGWEQFKNELNAFGLAPERSRS